MKNKWTIAFLVFSLFYFVSIGLYAQSAPVDQKLVGTWVDLSGNTWVFKSNGTVTYGDDDRLFKFAAFANKIVINGGPSYGSYDYIFSGNTVMLLPIVANSHGIVLTKKN
jgi:hypothetical protein